jgi:hypothetical protein
MESAVPAFVNLLPEASAERTPRFSSGWVRKEGWHYALAPRVLSLPITPVGGSPFIKITTSQREFSALCVCIDKLPSKERDELLMEPAGISSPRVQDAGLDNYL